MLSGYVTTSPANIWLSTTPYLPSLTTSQHWYENKSRDTGYLLRKTKLSRGESPHEKRLWDYSYFNKSVKPKLGSVMQFEGVMISVRS